MRKIILLSFFYMVLLFGISYASDTYTWTDEKGNVHYSNIPNKDSPISGEPEKIIIPNKEENTDNIDSMQVKDLFEKVDYKIDLINSEIFTTRMEGQEIERKFKSNIKRYANCLKTLENNEQTSYFDGYSLHTKDTVSPTKRASCRIAINMMNEQKSEFDAVKNRLRELKTTLQRLLDARMILINGKPDENVLLEIHKLLNES